MNAERCTHHACRCARAAELMQIADRTDDWRYITDALAVHEQEVECRAPRDDREET